MHKDLNAEEKGRLFKELIEKKKQTAIQENKAKNILKAAALRHKALEDVAAQKRAADKIGRFLKKKVLKIHTETVDKLLDILVSSDHMASEFGKQVNQYTDGLKTRLLNTATSQEAVNKLKMWMKKGSGMKHLVKDADEVVKRIEKMKRSLQKTDVQYSDGEKKIVNRLQNNAKLLVKFFANNGDKVDVRTLNSDVDLIEDVKIIERLEKAIKEKVDVPPKKKKKAKKKQDRKKKEVNIEGGGGGGGPGGGDAISVNSDDTKKAKMATTIQSAFRMKQSRDAKIREMTVRTADEIRWEIIKDGRRKAGFAKNVHAYWDNLRSNLQKKSTAADAATELAKWTAVRRNLVIDADTVVQDAGELNKYLDENRTFAEIDSKDVRIVRGTIDLILHNATKLTEIFENGTGINDTKLGKLKDLKNISDFPRVWQIAQRMLAAARKGAAHKAGVGGAAVAKGIGVAKNRTTGKKELFIDVKEPRSAGSSADDERSELQSDSGLEAELLPDGEKRNEELDRILGMQLVVGSDLVNRYTESAKHALQYRDPVKKIGAVLSINTFRNSRYPQSVKDYYGTLSYKYILEYVEDSRIDRELRFSVSNLQRFLLRSKEDEHPQEIQNVVVNSKIDTVFRRYPQKHSFFAADVPKDTEVTLFNVLWDVLILDMQKVATAKENLTAIVVGYEASRDINLASNEWLNKHSGEWLRALNAMNAILKILQHQLLFRVKEKVDFYTEKLNTGLMLQRNFSILKPIPKEEIDGRLMWMRKIGYFVDLILLQEVNLMIETARATIDIPVSDESKLSQFSSFAKSVVDEILVLETSKKFKQKPRRPSTVELISPMKKPEQFLNLMVKTKLYLFGSLSPEDMKSDYYSSSEDESTSPKPTPKKPGPRTKLAPLYPQVNKSSDIRLKQT
eukprot:3940337-Rhodomonas_salina.1